MNLPNGAADKSREYMQTRLDLVEEQEEEMKEEIVNDYEQHAETKQKMEMNISSLEKQIEMVQAITHLNTERLD